MIWMLGIMTAMAQDPAVSAQTATSAKSGSLWADGRARMLVGMEGNARMVGDLITVTISERTSTSVMAGTQTTRDSDIKTGVGTIFGLEQKLFSLYPELGGKIELDATTGQISADGTTPRRCTGRYTTCKVVEVRRTGT